MIRSSSKCISCPAEQGFPYEAAPEKLSQMLQPAEINLVHYLGSFQFNFGDMTVAGLENEIDHPHFSVVGVLDRGLAVRLSSRRAKLHVIGEPIERNARREELLSFP